MFHKGKKKSQRNGCTYEIGNFIDIKQYAGASVEVVKLLKQKKVISLSDGKRQKDIPSRGAT